MTANCKNINQSGIIPLVLSGGTTSVLNYRITIKDILALEICLLVAIDFIGDFLSGIESVRYLFDVVNLLLLVCSATLWKTQLRKLRGLVGCVSFFAALSLASAIANMVNPALVIWEANNVFRLFVFLLLVITYWDFEYFKCFLEAIYKLQWINFAFVLLEFFGLGLIRDNVGGFFGIVQGCNAPLNMYLCINCTYALCCFMGREGKKSGGSLIATLAMSFLIASIAELKFFYIELVVIAAIAIVFSKLSYRTVLVVATVAIAILAGLEILKYLIPGHYLILTNLDLLLNEANNTNLATGYGISRINVFNQIGDTFFQNDCFETLFGQGLGSAASSSMDIFTSPLYNSLGYLHFDYLTTSLIFIQCGYVGSLVYAGCIFCCVIPVLRNRYLISINESWLFSFTIAIVTLFFLNAFYNNIMHESYAMVWAVVLAGGYLFEKSFSMNRTSLRLIVDK